MVAAAEVVAGAALEAGAEDAGAEEAAAEVAPAVGTVMVTPALLQYDWAKAMVARDGWGQSQKKEREGNMS